MPRWSEEKMAIGFVVLIAIWSLVALPLIYLDETGSPLIRFWHWATHDAVAAFTAVLAISTIGLWIVTWRGIRAQARDTQILQRAYVSIEPGGLTAHRDRDDRLHTTVILKNVGNLPARSVRWYGTFGNPDRAHDFPVEEPAGGEIVLPPGSVSRQRIGTVFTDKLQNSLFVWGLVTYDDGFGKQRFTRFCHVYGTKNIINGRDVTLPPENAELYEYGNSAN